MSGRNGGTLLVGPTNKGGTGRPPDEFRARMRELSTYVEKQGYVQEVLKDPKHPHWMRAVEFVTERGYGKVPQEHTGKDGGPIAITVSVNYGAEKAGDVRD